MHRKDVHYVSEYRRGQNHHETNDSNQCYKSREKVTVRHESESSC